MIERTFPWIPWYEQRYRDATKWFESPHQHMIYRPLCVQYCVEGPLRDDDADLRGTCMMQASEWDAVWAKYWPKIKERHFTERAGVLHNNFGDQVRAWQRKEPQQKSSAGTKGAKIRWENERKRKAGGKDDVEPEDKWAEVHAAASAYNCMAERLSWPLCARLSDERKKKLGARLKDLTKKGDPPPLEGWDAALERAAASDFLMGRAGRSEEHKNWTMDLDFLLQEKSFTKLMEGFYDNRKGNGSGGAVGVKPGGPPPSKDDRRGAILSGARAGFVATGRAAPDLPDT